MRVRACRAEALRKTQSIRKHDSLPLEVAEQLHAGPIGEGCPRKPKNDLASRTKIVPA